jgi:macrolide transport system ATP-binding/permease protein
MQGEPYRNLFASLVRVNSEYFDAVGTRVILGRGFTQEDPPRTAAVAIVNQEFVRKVIGNRNPIGRRFGSPGSTSSGSYRIIGVVDDTTYTTVRWKGHMMFFVPLMERPAGTPAPIAQDEGLYSDALVLETNHSISDLEPLVRQTLAAINPDLTVVKFESFSQQVADRFSEDRMVAELTTLLAGLALVLAMVGLYGVTAYTVGRRTNEIGIRIALGASRGRVITAVMTEAAFQAAVGLAFGVPAAIGAGYLVASQLFGVRPYQPPIIAGAASLLGLAVLVAAGIPARRAASVDPMQALRSE